MAVTMAEIQAVVTADVSQAESALTSVGQTVDQLGQKGAGVGQNLTTVGTGLGLIGGAATGFFAAAVGEAASFEQQLSGIASVGGQPAIDAMADIEAAALRMGAQTSFSAQEAAAGMEELIKAGVPVQDTLDGAAQGALDLAAATGITVPDAAAAMAQALNVFGDTLPFDTMAEKATNVADVFAQVANASATGANEIAAGFGNAAPVAEMFGLTMEETAKAIGMMSNAGIDGAEAGTMLKSMLLQLNTPSKQQAQAMRELGLTYDDLFDSAGNLVGIPEMFDLIRESAAASGLPAREVEERLASIFGSYGITAASVFFKTQEEGWAALEQGMANAGTAQEQAQVRLDNLSGAMEALGGSVQTAAIALGQPLIGPIRMAAEGLTTLVNLFINLPAPVQAAVSVLGALAGVLTGGLGAAILIVPKVLAFSSAMQGLGVASKAASLAFGPLGIAIAAIGVAVAAYQNNWLGFGDAVDRVAGNVRDLLTPALTAIQSTIAAVQAAFTGFRAEGLDPIAAAVAALSSVFPGLAGAFETAGALARTFGDTLAGIAAGLEAAIAALAAGDLGGVLQGLFDAAMASVTGFIDGLVIIGGAILDAFAAVDWQAISDGIGAGLQQASDALQTWFQEQADAIIAWAQGIDWGAVGSAIEAGITAAMALAGEAMAAGWAAIQDAVGPAWEAITQQVSSAWDAIVAAIEGALTTVQETIGSAWTAIQEQVSTATLAIQEQVSGAWITIQNDIAARVDGIRLAITDAWGLIQTTVSEKMTAIQEAVAAAWTAIQDAVTTASTAIQTTVSEAWQAIQTGVGAQLDTLAIKVDTVWESISTAINDATSTIQTTITEAWQAIQAGVGAQLDALVTNVTTTFSEIVTAVTTAGTEMKEGFLGALESFVDEALAAVQGVKDAIVGFFDGAAGWLLDAGAAIIQGLVDGITSKLPDLGGAIGAVRGKIEGLGGLLGGSSYDAGISAGEMLTTGTAQGIELGTRGVEIAGVGMVAALETAVDSAGMMHSPSQLMFQRGVWLVEGMIGGAESLRGDLEAAFTMLTDLVVAIFADLESAVLAHMDTIVSGVEQAADDAAAAVASLHKTATSVGGVEPGDREAKEASYARDQRRLDREARRAGDESVDREARSRERERSGRGGDTYIKEVNVRDGRDFDRWLDTKRRSERRAAGTAIG